MAWLLTKAEDLLNKVDQGAAVALQGGSQQNNTPLIEVTTHTTSHNTYLSANRLAEVPVAKLSKKVQEASVKPVHNSKVRVKQKDEDEKLFEFLNSTEPAIPSRKISTPTQQFNGHSSTGHSRHSSISSIGSMRSGKSEPVTATTTGMDISMEGSHDADLFAGRPAVDQSEVIATIDVSEATSATDENLSQRISALELENQLLRNEVGSLNQEITTALQRAKNAERDMTKEKKKANQWNAQLSEKDKQVRELMSQNNDLTEALGAKDSQLAVLRIRLQEADSELSSKRQHLEQLQGERERILKDHTDSSGIHSQALDTLREKLQEAEANLKHSQESYQKLSIESMETFNRVSSEKQNNAAAAVDLEKRLADERAKVTDLTRELRQNKSSTEAVRQELNDYKQKAQRILQSKDKLIVGLKESAGMGGESSVLNTAEMEELKQERDLAREELQQLNMTVESLRAELQDMESQMQLDSDSYQDHIRSLDDQLAEEKRKLDEVEHDLLQQKEEGKYLTEELRKHKLLMQSRIQDRDHEIERLRNQLTAKQANSNSESELEARVHSLTESLIQKQTMLEALSTEKNSLVLQLERIESQYREAEKSLMRATSAAVHINDDDDGLRSRVPSLFKENPHDNKVAKSVKKAYTSIDKFSVRLGIFLRRYPIARSFVIFYMVLLHFWVMVVLLTYTPEMHKSGCVSPDSMPHLPNMKNN